MANRSPRVVSGVVKKPSVSLMMTYLSCAFIVFWLVAIAGLLVRDYAL